MLPFNSLCFAWHDGLKIFSLHLVSSSGLEALLKEIPELSVCFPGIVLEGLWCAPQEEMFSDNALPVAAPVRNGPPFFVLFFFLISNKLHFGSFGQSFRFISLSPWQVSAGLASVSIPLWCSCVELRQRLCRRSA